MEEDDYGSDEWGEIDYNDLIAAANEVEKQATPSKSQQQDKGSWGGNSLIFVEDDFDDFNDDDMLSAAVPSIAIPAPNPQVRQAHNDLASSTETLQADGSPQLKEEEEEEKNVPSNENRVPKPEADGSPPLKKEGGGNARPNENRDPKPEANVVGKRPEVTDAQPAGGRDHELVLSSETENGMNSAVDGVKRKISDHDSDATDHTRRKIEYSGTVFPRFTRAYEKDLADAVSVAEFSLRLMEILTSVLREFLVASITSYPRQHRIDIARDINRMVGHNKANASFQGWDFLALANFILYHRNSLPRFIQKPQDIVERLRVLKTTMRWTVAHTSLQEEERKHPIELSLWAINTLFLIENLQVPMDYASKVMSLHQRLWSQPPSPPPYVSQTG